MAFNNKPRICLYCNKNFTATNPNHFYCSIPCRFWSKVNIVFNSCWEWQAGRQHEYAEFRIKGFVHRAHRIAYKLTCGKIPNGKCVLHKCDNPICVNPSHLFLGTRATNNRDKMEKGRSARGEKSWSAKLTEKEVIKIREYIKQGHSLKGLAKIFNVHPATISNIKAKYTWKHI